MSNKRCKEDHDCKVSKRSSDFRHSPGSYDYSGLAHWWAYNHGHRSTAGGRMSCSGTRIYSYTTVVARMFDPPKGRSEPLVLVSNERHSNTTQKHIGAILNAVRHMNVLYVDDVDPYRKQDHLHNLRSILNSQITLGASYKSKRADTTRQAVVDGMISNKKKAEMYATYFKLRNTSEYKQIMKIPIPGDPNFDEELEEYNKKKMAAEARAKAKKAKQLAKEKKEQFERAQENLKKWLSGENVYVDYGMLDKVYLRVKGDMIETTERAKIPLKEAVIAFKRFKKGKLREGMHVGPYAYSGIDSDGNAHIGCHVVPLQSIEDLMKDIGGQSKNETVGEDVESFDSLISELEQFESE